MQNFITALLICSVNMSALALIYMACSPLLRKRYSDKWLYYAWLIIILGLIIPFRPQLGTAFFNVEVTTVTPQVFAAGEAPVYFTAAAALPPVESGGVLTAATLDVSWQQIAAAVWAAGVLLFMAFHGIQHYRFMKMTDRWREKIADEDILSALESLKEKMGIKKQIPLYLCPTAGSPMMVGLIKPLILLPTTYLSQNELCFILKHELVHYKRKDLLYKYLLFAAMALHWFNPVVYLISKAVNVLCEASCDSEVVRDTDEEARLSYSETIISVVRYKSRLRTALSTNFYGGKKGMKNRISSIMDIRNKKAGAVIAGSIMVFTMSTGLVFAAANSTEADRNPDIFNIATADDSASIAPADNSLFNAEALVVLGRLGVTFDGIAPSDNGGLEMSERQNIYYRGQLARVFADAGGGSWITSYTQGGLIDIHVLRDAGGHITGVSVVPVEYAAATPLVPVHTDEEDYRRQSMFASVEAGTVASDELPLFWFLSRGEVLGELSLYEQIEQRHSEMSREELVFRLQTGRLIAYGRIAAPSEGLEAYFDWARENYSEWQLRVYREMGAPLWFIERLAKEITSSD